MTNKLLKAVMEKTNKINVELTIGNVEVRQMLVKELKQIIDLGSMEDESAAMVEMIKIIDNCILTPGVSMNTLPSIDVETIYLALHRLTKGDTVEMKLHCGHCDKEFDQNIYLALAHQSNEQAKQIKLDTGLVLNMRAPTMLESLIGAADSDQIFNLAIRCIESVDTGTETMVVGEDISPEEMREVVEFFNENSFAELVKFIETIPHLYLRQPVECPHCQEQDLVELNGLAEILG
ncbi:gp26 family baseplate hub assembly chaperone [Aeromonas veronii]|uniref:gp26 family baseplate hub assembly chaperone n=1 Tax=Aeromonas veronii TaxID=654 RepID=UPI001CD5012F|nr:gp26 family baseplate hub assembly chaperone [Aeromonas veronii]UBR47450.1 gp26 family baseplate hub assembly chaperone [Aeromonas veronii]